MKINSQKFNTLKKSLKKAGIKGLTTNEAYLKTGIMRPTIDRYFEILKEKKEVIEIEKGSAKMRINPMAALKDLEKYRQSS